MPFLVAYSYEFGLLLLKISLVDNFSCSNYLSVWIRKNDCNHYVFDNSVDWLTTNQLVVKKIHEWIELNKLTTQERSRWKILDKGISECRAWGRKKPTASATCACLSWKGIVTHKRGVSSPSCSITSTTSWLLGSISNSSANLRTTKLFPTPGCSEDTTRTFKL